MFFKGSDGNCVMVGRPCPENGDHTKGDYCPCWIEVVEREGGRPDGAMITRQDCTHRIMHNWVADASKAQWHTTDMASRIPAEINKGFQGLGQVVAQHLMTQGNQQEVLTDESDHRANGSVVND